MKAPAGRSWISYAFPRGTVGTWQTVAAVAAAILIAAARGAAQPPALPPGLAEPKPPPDEPALPPGLEDEAEKTEAEPEPEGEGLLDRLHGFWEVRAGVRTEHDRRQPRDFILGETRLQLDFERVWDRVSMGLTGDILFDAVLEEVDFDLRKQGISWTPVDSVDISAGRQVFTWGTGDLLFINDLFPKDWQSFLSGRDEEYLKAPSTAVKTSWFNPWFNVDVVYTPQFEHDRFITGERISYWDPLRGRRAGRDDEVDYNAPSDWFDDDEIAVRVSQNISGHEVAAYGYSGYWKSPAGQRLIPLQASFPRLAVYGASYRAALGKGIFNVEAGYYDSRDDSGGDDPFVRNSEFRFLVGYERELANEFTGSVQYYLEHMMDYDAYRNTLPFFVEPQREDRHVVTLRLTKLLLNQDLTLSGFIFYSPSDNDAYIRPNVKYKITDNWEVSGGANVFAGEDDHTFFGQFEKNTNVYAAVRYAF